MEIPSETALKICCNARKLELTIGRRRENGGDQYRFTIGRTGHGKPWVESVPYPTSITARRQLLSALFHSLEQTQRLFSEGDYRCQYVAARRTASMQQSDLLSGEQIAWIARQLERSSIITTTVN